MKINTITTGDWDLIVSICCPSNRPHIPHHAMNEAYKAAWKWTDAYGALGYIPPQGYDWSGFRDSTKESNAKSANAIRVVLAKHGITEFETEKAF